MIKNEDKQLKLFRDKERKCYLENEELQKKVATKEAEAFSLIEVMKDNERLEGEKKNLL